MYILSPKEGTYFQYDIVNRLKVQLCTYFDPQKALIFCVI